MHTGIVGPVNDDPVMNLISFDPISSARLLVMVLAALVLNTAYCLTYNLLSGHPEELADALAWGLVFVVPWVAAIEIGRHARSLLAVGLVLCCAVLTALTLRSVLTDEWPSLLFLVRLLPGLAFAGVVITALWARKALPAKTDHPDAADSLVDCQFDFIRGAGNYLELHGTGSPRLVRGTMAAAQERLGDTFVRIHRSYLVKRSAIVRIERASVLLECGRRLPLGPVYRAALVGE